MRLIRHGTIRIGIAWMAGGRKQLLSARKSPQQARSTELVSAILEAAIRVLEREGARRFTAARVAEKAGISVGSLYQYFPNKAAILFRLQSDEWERTAQQWSRILQDTKQAPLARLRTLVHEFIRSECDEAAIRSALSDAAPLFRDGPDQPIANDAVDSAMVAFMREVLPEIPDVSRRLATDLLEATLTEVGEHFSSEPRNPAEILFFADAMADMFEAYLGGLMIRH